MSARLVYSSGPDDADGDRRAERCARCRTAPCRCPAAEPAAGAGPVHVRCERAGRRGKTVTVAAPLALTTAAARELLRNLKRELGAGGSVRPAAEPGRVSIEIQGDLADRLTAALRRHGHDARAGGRGR